MFVLSTYGTYRLVVQLFGLVMLKGVLMKNTKSNIRIFKSVTAVRWVLDLDRLISNLKHYVAWYKKLREQGYGVFTSLDSALYNYKHYKIDGSYK